jgi:hypothetical protein
MPRYDREILREFFNMLLGIIANDQPLPIYDDASHEIIDSVCVGRDGKILEFQIYIQYKEGHFSSDAYIDELDTIIPSEIRDCATKHFMRWNANARDFHFAFKETYPTDWLILRASYPSSENETALNYYLSLRSAVIAIISKRLPAILEEVYVNCKEK